MNIIYKSVFDGLNDIICDTLDAFGIKYTRDTALNNALNMHETIITIECKNTAQIDGVKHILTGVNMLGAL